MRIVRLRVVACGDQNTRQGEHRSQYMCSFCSLVFNHLRPFSLDIGIVSVTLHPIPMNFLIWRLTLISNSSFGYLTSTWSTEELKCLYNCTIQVSLSRSGVAYIIRVQSHFVPHPVSFWKIPPNLYSFGQDFCPFVSIRRS